MIDRSTPRPWRSNKPVHETLSGWRVVIHDGTIPVARAVGVTRAHAVANAATIIKAVAINDRVREILAARPEDHEDARRLIWLREMLNR